MVAPINAIERRWYRHGAVLRRAAKTGHPESGSCKSAHHETGMTLRLACIHKSDRTPAQNLLQAAMKSVTLVRCGVDSLWCPDVRVHPDIAWSRCHVSDGLFGQTVIPPM